MKKLFTLLVLLVAIVTGAQAEGYTVANPATKTYGTGDAAKTFLDVANTQTNATIKEGNVGTIAYSCHYLTQTVKPAWVDNTGGAGGNSSAYTYTNITDYGFLTSSGSQSYTQAKGWVKPRNSKPVIFYVTGVSGIAVIAASNSSSKRVSISVAEYNADGTTGEATEDAGSSTNPEIIESTATLDAAKYYKITVKTKTGDSDAEQKLHQIRFIPGPAGAITPTITTETATVEEGKTVSALDFITAKNGSSTLTDVTYSNFAVSAGSEYVSVAADGTITGLTGGAGHTATITFDSNAVTDKYEKTEGNELTVNVVAAKQELTLAYSGDVELTAGQTFTPATLTATAGGNTVDVATLGLTYESSNTDLATVNATTGEVTLVAKATGTATIKAKLQDNATYSDTKASYTITVNKIPVPKFYIDGVEIANGATVADFTTGQTIVIEAPGYYIYSNWSSSDTKSKSDYYKDGGVKGQDSYKASTLTTGKRVLYAVAGDDEHAQGNSSDLAKVIFSNVTAGSIEVSISAAGYATLYYSSLPLAVPANVTAKTYKVDNGNIVVSKTYAAESVIPQGEPVVLEGAAGDYTFTVKKDESATKDANSMLKGLDAAGQTTGEGLFYKLAQKDGKVGFYWGAAEGAAFALQGDHHAYLVVPASTGAREFYAFSEEVSTGINSANVQTVNDNAPIYNLAGQKVSKGYKGIVIVNGRKMLNK